MSLAGVVYKKSSIKLLDLVSFHVWGNNTIGIVVQTDDHHGWVMNECMITVYDIKTHRPHRTDFRRVNVVASMKEPL
jgi:hypothetical protein